MVNYTSLQWYQLPTSLPRYIYLVINWCTESTPQICVSISSSTVSIFIFAMNQMLRKSSLNSRGSWIRDINWALKLANRKPQGNFEIVNRNLKHTSIFRDWGISITVQNFRMYHVVLTWIPPWGAPSFPGSKTFKSARVITHTAEAIFLLKKCQKKF